MFGHRLSTHFYISCVKFVHSSNSPFLYSSYGRYFILLLCSVVCKLDIHHLSMDSHTHTGQTCCGLLDIFVSSARFSGTPEHSITCIYIHECDLVLILCIVGCLQDYPSSRHRFLSRFLIVVLLSSLHKHTAFNYLPSNHVLASSHVLSFHSAFIYTHHKGEKYQNGHSFTQKGNKSY